MKLRGHRAPWVALLFAGLVAAGCSLSAETAEDVVPGGDKPRLLAVSDWDAVLADARGETVNWYLWGGSESIDRFVDENYGPVLQEQFRITLNYSAAPGRRPSSTVTSTPASAWPASTNHPHGSSESLGYVLSTPAGLRCGTAPSATPANAAPSPLHRPRLGLWSRPGYADRNDSGWARTAHVLRAARPTKPTPPENATARLVLANARLLISPELPT